MSSAKKNAASVLPPPAAPIPAKSTESAAKTEAIDVANPDKSVIDMDILGQLLEMDDDDEHSFSKPLVEEYLEQAGVTLDQMVESLANKKDDKAAELLFLSDKGHFLKGSSAALGVIKVRDSCEALQNLGRKKDAAGSSEISEDKAWTECTKLIPALQEQHAQAKKWLVALIGLETSS